MDILVKTSNEYVKYLKVLMISVYENNRDTLDDPDDGKIIFWCLHTELTEEKINEIKCFAASYGQEAHCIFVDENIFKDLPSSGGWPKNVYSILLAHQFLPSHVHRVISLDLDIIVNGSLRDFFHLDFGDNYLIASREWQDARLEPAEEFKEFTYLESANERDLLAGLVFNTGSMLVNLDKFRADKIDINFYVSRLHDKKLKLADQSSLNYCFYRNVKFLTTCKYNYRIASSIPDYYNANVRHKKGLDAYVFYPIEAKIIHYCGYTGIKPWKIKLEKGDIPRANNAYLEFIPQSVQLVGIWWKYAKLLPKPEYESLLIPAEINAAAYRMLYMCVNSRPYNFHNALKLEPLSAPTWSGRNNINSRSNLNDYIIPNVYICDNHVKATIINLPNDFIENTSFRLTVKQLAVNPSATSPILQILEADNADATIWRRLSKDNGRAWGDWKRLANISDVYERENGQKNIIEKLTLINTEMQELDNRLSLLKTIDFKSIINDCEKNKTEINKTKNELENINNRLNEIINSASFKIGRAITFIPRKIRDTFRKKKK